MGKKYITLNEYAKIISDFPPESFTDGYTKEQFVLRVEQYINSVISRGLDINKYRLVKVVTDAPTFPGQYLLYEYYFNEGLPRHFHGFCKINNLSGFEVGFGMKLLLSRNSNIGQIKRPLDYLFLKDEDFIRVRRLIRYSIYEWS